MFWRGFASEGWFLLFGEGSLLAWSNGVAGALLSREIRDRTPGIRVFIGLVDDDDDSWLSIATSSRGLTLVSPLTCHIFSQLRMVDHLARRSMKNAANCAKHGELQGFMKPLHVERILRPWLTGQGHTHLRVGETFLSREACLFTGACS